MYTRDTYICSPRLRPRGPAGARQGHGPSYGPPIRDRPRRRSGVEFAERDPAERNREGDVDPGSRLAEAAGVDGRLAGDRTTVDAPARHSSERGSARSASARSTLRTFAFQNESKSVPTYGTEPPTTSTEMVAIIRSSVARETPSLADSATM